DRRGGRESQPPLARHRARSRVRAGVAGTIRAGCVKRNQRQRAKLLGMHRSLTVILTLIIAAPAPAWNKAGHMVSGAIAAAALKQDNPATFAKVVELLKAHPQYAERWSKRLEDAPDGDRDLMLFMLAARWPDDIR